MQYCRFGSFLLLQVMSPKPLDSALTDMDVTGGASSSDANGGGPRGLANISPDISDSPLQSWEAAGDSLLAETPEKANLRRQVHQLAGTLQSTEAEPMLWLTM